MFSKYTSRFIPALRPPKRFSSTNKTNASDHVLYFLMGGLAAASVYGIYQAMYRYDRLKIDISDYDPDEGTTIDISIDISIENNDHHFLFEY